MAFDSVAEFLAMGGHGLYVWLSYGATYLVLLGLWLGGRAAHQRALRDIAARETRRSAGAR